MLKASLKEETAELCTAIAKVGAIQLSIESRKLWDREVSDKYADLAAALREVREELGDTIFCAVATYQEPSFHPIWMACLLLGLDSYGVDAILIENMTKLKRRDAMKDSAVLDRFKLLSIGEYTGLKEVPATNAELSTRIQILTRFSLGYIDKADVNGSFVLECVTKDYESIRVGVQFGRVGQNFFLRRLTIRAGITKDLKLKMFLHNTPRGWVVSRGTYQPFMKTVGSKFGHYNLVHIWDAKWLMTPGCLAVSELPYSLGSSGGCLEVYRLIQKEFSRLITAVVSTYEEESRVR
jgi:hypothetical protein